MGDRVSIEFRKEKNKSGVVLFSHWGGMEFVETAKKYAKNLEKRKKGIITTPLDRLEPQTVMVDFIRFITNSMKEVDSDLYLGLTENDGDNSDNGHHIIMLKKLPIGSEG